MIGAVFIWGRYGVYVWPAYGITLAAVSVTVLLVWRSYRRAQARLAEMGKSGGAYPDEG